VQGAQNRDAERNTNCGPEKLTNVKAVIRARNGLLVLEQKNTEHNQPLINAGRCKTDEKDKNIAMLKKQTAQKKKRSNKYTDILCYEGRTAHLTSCP
jgi:hypothetical protein